MTAADRLTALRRLMARYGVQAYVVPSSDPHQSEYVPECWQRRAFLTGFTGSAGDAVVTRRAAGLWTDSRYWLRAEREIDRRAFTLFKAGRPGVPSWADWAAAELRPGDSLGIDPRLVSNRDYLSLKTRLEDKGRKLKPVGPNLIDAIWPDRPTLPLSPAEAHPVRYAGESAAAKLERVRAAMAEAGAQAHVLSQLDAIAWLFNIRGSDVAFNPVVIAYAVILGREALLFMDKRKVTPGLRRSLPRSVRILAYQAFGAVLNWLADRRARVWLDEASASRWMVGALRGSGRLMFRPSPVALLKAVKNAAEVRGARQAHVRDGVAMVRFLRWLEGAVPRGGLTELAAAAKCAEFRSREKLFKGLSFETISSYGPHGPIVHYAPNQETDIPLKQAGLYLIDSGSQYSDATTDITRTVALGRPTAKHKEYFTRVLKGLIALSAVSFPRGTSGKQLDTIARLPLWDKGLNFIHGTGHGLGTFLNVHEGPQAISYYRCLGVPFEPGMLTTIEPGLYPEKEFGLRTENVAVVVKDKARSSSGTDFYAFETLTLCPIDRALIDKSLLSPKEIDWLDAYHDRVRRTLSPRLGREDAAWLARATRPL